MVASIHKITVFVFYKRSLFGCPDGAGSVVEQEPSSFPSNFDGDIRQAIAALGGIIVS